MNTKESTFEIYPTAKKSTETLIIDIDSFHYNNIKQLKFLVGGKEHLFTTDQISKFFDYIKEGFCEN